MPGIRMLSADHQGVNSFRGLWAKHVLHGRHESSTALRYPPLNHPPEGPHSAGIRMLSPNHQSANSFLGIFGNPKADPPAHRIAPKKGLCDVQRVQHRDNVRHPSVQHIRVGIARLVTGPMSSRIDEDEPVVGS